ncbi:MAG: hypothetical protein WB462_13490 [Solirubrobacterales bacterium]
MATPPTSESAPAPAALSDGDQLSIVERRENDPKLVALVRQAEGSEVAAGRKGKRAEYFCAACGYGIVVYGRPPGCPMCREGRWEHVEYRPSSRLLDDLALPLGAQSQRRRLHTPSSATAEEPIRYLRPGQAGASLEK